jgi:hypothetical protein
LDHLGPLDQRVNEEKGENLEALVSKDPSDQLDQRVQLVKVV